MRGTSSNINDNCLNLEARLIETKSEIQNISWMRRHFAWVLPSNLGQSRFSYSDQLQLKINSNQDEMKQSDDAKVIFKPWSNRKLNHKEFAEIYSNLRKGIPWEENKSFCYYLQSFLQCVVFILLSPILIILMLILYPFIIITRVIGPFISSCFRSTFKDSETGIIDKDSGVRISTKYSTLQNNRFAVYRLTQYIYWITIHLFTVLSRFIVGKQCIPLVKDEELIVYMHSNQHLRFDYDQNENIIAGFIDDSDVIEIAEHHLYKGRYFPIKKIHLDYVTNILSFTLNGYGNDDKIVSNKPGNCSDDVWNAVKANYMAQRCFMDTLVHSWVHFHFSDIASKHLYKYFGSNPNTVLGQLLHSHFIYTSVVNMAGAGDGLNQPQISGDVDSLINRINPVKAFSIKKEGTLSILTMKIKQHYFEDNNHQEIDQNMFPPEMVKQRLKIFNPNNYETVRGYSLYWDMVSDYYLSVHKFISKLNENGLIDLKELRGFIQEINNDGMNGLSKCNELDVLCTLIWTNGFIHGTDHITYYNILKNFPFMVCYNKLNITNNNKNVNIDYKSILHSWSACWTSVKSEMFVNTFTQPTNSCLNSVADYSASPNLYRKFINALEIKNDQQKFQLINNIHDEYLQSLYNVSDKYDWMMHVNEFDASISY